MHSPPFLCTLYLCSLLVRGTGTKMGGGGVDKHVREEKLSGDIIAQEPSPPHFSSEGLGAKAARKLEGKVPKQQLKLRLDTLPAKWLCTDIKRMHRNVFVTCQRGLKDLCQLTMLCGNSGRKWGLSKFFPCMILHIYFLAQCSYMGYNFYYWKKTHIYTF